MMRSMRLLRLRNFCGEVDVGASLFIVCSYATNTNISKGGQLSKCLVSFTEIAGQPQMKQVVRSAEICTIRGFMLESQNHRKLRIIS